MEATDFKLLLYNRKGGSVVGEALVDEVHYKKLKNYIYLFKPGRLLKPYREKKSKDGLHRKLFLSRDVYGLQYKNPKTVKHKNGDILDCRSNNIVEGPTRIVNDSPVSSRDYKWPVKFIHLKNFLESYKEDEAIKRLEDVFSYKYSKKIIVLTYDTESNYIKDDKTKKETRVVIKKTLRKYFDLWEGDVIIGVTYEKIVKKQPSKQLPPTSIVQGPEKIKEERSMEIARKELNLMKQEHNDIKLMEDQNINVLITNNDKTLYILKRKLRETKQTNPKMIMEIIKDSSIVSTDDLIKEIRERGAKDIKF